MASKLDGASVLLPPVFEELASRQKMVRIMQRWGGRFMTM